jgi:hypothetical protein
LDEIVVAIRTRCIIVAVHLRVAIHSRSVHLITVHVAVHGGTIDLRAVESGGQGGHWAIHLAGHGAIAHRAVQVMAHWRSKGAVVHAANANLGTHLCSLVLFAHAVDVWPEALLEPTYLSEDFFAANHLFFAVASSCDVGQFIDECARCIDEFGEGRRSPVWNERLVEGDDMGVGGGGREGVAEGGSVLPGGTVALPLLVE